MRVLPLLSLGLLLLPACYSHHTADEQVIELSPLEDAGVADGAVSDAGRDGGRDGGSDACAGLTGVEAFLCGLTSGGGGLEDIIGDILGGGGSTQNCARETDPIAQLLCQVSGGSGLEGLLGDLLGGGTGSPGALGGLGGLLGDAGVGGLLQGAISDVLTGIIDDLIASLFQPRNRDAGAFLGGGGFLGGSGISRPDAGNKALSLEDDGYRSSEQCQAVQPEDLLTRLLCLRQAVDQLAQRSGPGAIP